MSKKTVSLPSRKDVIVDSRILTFVNFLEVDNGGEKCEDPSRSVAIIRHICRALRQLVQDLQLDQVYAQFSKNDSLKSFISTYLMNRKRPYEVLNERQGIENYDEQLSNDRRKDTDLNEDLLMLDKLVFMTAFRMVTPLEMPAMNKPSITQIQNCPLLHLQSLTSIFCIAGDSNAIGSIALMENLVALTSINFVAERVARMTEECLRVVERLVIQCEGVVALEKGNLEKYQVKASDDNCALKPKRIVSLKESKKKRKTGNWEADSRLLLGTNTQIIGTAHGNVHNKASATSKNTMALSEAHQSALFAQDVASCLSALLVALPRGVATVGGPNSLLTCSGGALCAGGLALIMALRTLFDSVLPALELIACQASNKATETVPADDQLSKVIRRAVCVCRDRTVHAFMSLANAATHGSSGKEGGGAGEESEVGWVQALSSLLPEGHAEHPVLIYETFGTAEKDIDGKSVAAMLEAHLLRLGEDDEEAVRYMFSSLKASRADQLTSMGGTELAQSGILSATALLAEALPNVRAEDGWGLGDVSDGSSEPVDSDGADHASAVKKLETVAALHALFPELGDGFCYACLDSFEWDLERTADAVLSQNLPPAIANMNQTISARLNKVTNDLRRTVREAERDVEEAASREKEKRRLLQVQALEEENYLLLKKHGMGDTWEPANVTVEKEREQGVSHIEKEEEEKDRAKIVAAVVSSLYDDDYDDQWDDAPVAIPAAHKEQGAVVSGRRMDKKKRNDKESKREAALRTKQAFEQAAREQDEVRRVNQLLREREESVAYWRELGEASAARNANRGKKDDSSALMEHEEGFDMSSPPPSHGSRKKATSNILLKGAGQPGGRANLAGQLGQLSQASRTQEGEPGPDQTRKPRTKTYDKHHQKSRALKRGDVFKG